MGARAQLHLTRLRRLARGALFAAAAAALSLLPLLAAEGLVRLAVSDRVPPPETFSEPYIRYVAELRGPLFTGAPAAPFGYFPSRRRPAMPKPPGTLRVFCVGESTVLLPGFVESIAARLAPLNPRARWEFVNAGVGAVDARYLEGYALETLDYAPDLLVLYFGNNARYRHPRAPAWALRAWNAAQRSALLRLALSWARRPAPDYDRVLGDVLERVVQAARRRGVPVLLAIPSRNLLFPPEGRLSPEAAEDAASACAAYESGAWALARRRLAEAARRHPAAAAVRYRLGRAALETGRCREAREQLEHALRLDAREDRMPASTGRMLRSWSGKRGASIFDADAAIGRASRCGVPGFEAFVDAMHPTARGYAALGDSALGAADATLREALGRAVSASPGVTLPEARREPAGLSWLVDHAVDRSACAGDSPEMAVALFEAAFRADPRRASALLAERLSDGAPNEDLGWDPRRCSWARAVGLARVYAGAAQRRLGNAARAEALFSGAAVSREPAVLAALDVQRALGETLAGRPDAARRLRTRALARDPSAAGDPWLRCR